MSKMVKVQQLQSVVGDEVFYKLVKRFGGNKIYIPKNHNIKNLNKKSRNQIIREGYYKGMHVDDLSIEYGLSRSRIYKIIEKE